MSTFFDTLLLKKSILKTARLSLVIFGFICFITAIIISSYTVDQKDYHEQEAPCRIGPIQGNSTYMMSVTQHLPVHSWAFLEVSIETKDEQTLFSVGKELWHEQGRDSDGRWTESETVLNYDFVLPKGEFYLKVEILEKSIKSSGNLEYELFSQLGIDLPNAKSPTITNKSLKELGYNMNISLQKRLGAPYMMLIASVISFVVASILTIIIGNAKYL